MRQALVDAVQELRGLGLAARRARSATCRPRRAAASGSRSTAGRATAGVFNAINVRAADLKAGKGYEDVPHGSSFVQAVAFTDGACPVTPRTILTYSQSANARSPFYADQTRMYSRKQWNPVPFCRPDVLAQTVSTTRLGAAQGVRGADRARAGCRRGGAGAACGCAGPAAGARRSTCCGAGAASRASRGAGGVRPCGCGERGCTWSASARAATRAGSACAGAPRRLRVLPAFERRARCARVRLLSLGAPAFRGRLRIAYRLSGRARVRLTIRRGGRVVRVIRRRAARSGRVRIAARPGRYRVTLRVGRTRVPVSALRL